MFKENVGTVDRAIRALIGLGLVALVFVGPKTPFGWLGLIPLLTAALGTCPLYTVLGFSSCPAQKSATR